MSTERGGGNAASKRVGETGGRSSTPGKEIARRASGALELKRLEASTESRRAEAVQEDAKPSANSAEQDKAMLSLDVDSKPRQVIAVSASKGPAAFFNLARKFLVTDEMCDLSALEGAIVSAVDAAHLLERSKLATIARVQTAYVTVEPKKKKQQPQYSQTRSLAASVSSVEIPVATENAASAPASPSIPPIEEHLGPVQEGGSATSAPRPTFNPTGLTEGRELRRARIVITVKRTKEYEQWLEENPLQAIIVGDADDGANHDTTAKEGMLPHQRPT